MSRRTMTANFIESKRIQKNLSQKDVADALGYDSSQFISNVERGLCLFPISKFKKLSKIFSVPVETVLAVYLHDKEQQARKELGL